MEGRRPSGFDGGILMTWSIAPWFIAGPLIGLLIIGLRAAANRPFGALGGFVELAENVLSPQRFGFRAYLLAGLVIGGLVFALVSGSFSFSWAYGDAGSIAAGSFASESILLAFAGLIMGFGARTAGGCTSGHGLCGMSLLSPASIVATMTFFVTAVFLSLLVSFVGGAS
jgi:uncharacterized membrane protein YedE/YeeE